MGLVYVIHIFEAKNVIFVLGGAVVAALSYQVLLAAGKYAVSKLKKTGNKKKG